MTDASDAKATGKGVQVLERVKAILDALAQSPLPLSLLALSKQCELHPSTAHRIIWNLYASGFVERVGNNWQLGVRFLDFGARYLARSKLVALAKPYLQTLSKRTGEIALLAIHDGNHSIVLNQAVPDSSCSSSPLPIGCQLELHRCGSGKVFLSQLPFEALSAYLASLRKTETNPAIESLLIEITQIRERGWSDSFLAEPIAKHVISAGLGTEVPTSSAISLLTQEDHRLHPDWVDALLSTRLELRTKLQEHRTDKNPRLSN